MDYLNLTAPEYAAVVALIDSDDVASVQLCRRDSFDHLCDDGFLVVSIVPKDGEQWRMAISRTGSTTPWGL